MKLYCVLVSAVLFSLPVFAFTSTGSSGGTGTGTSGTGQPEAKNIETVTPGHSFTNNDVTVDNKADSNGNVTVDPKTGTPTSNTTVKMQSDTVADVTGLEAGDTVNVSTDSTVKISGEGGTVNMNGTGSTATVTNTAAAGSGNILTVKGPGNMTVEIPAGATVTIKT